MFSEYQGFIDLDSVLEKEYGYRYNGNLEDFYRQNFVELEGIGKDAVCWIIYNGERFLFKAIDNFDCNVWGELLSESVAHTLNIPCAEYRACTLHGKKGVLSKSFVYRDTTLMLGTEVLQKYCLLHLKKHSDVKHIFHYFNHVKGICSILKDNDNISDGEYHKIEEYLFQMLLFDLVTLQSDRHPNNWGVMVKDNCIKPALLFDNDVSFGVGNPNTIRNKDIFRSEYMNARLLRDKSRIFSIIYQNKPIFTYDFDNILDIEKKVTDIFPNVFISLLNDIDSDRLEFVKSFLEKARDIDLEAKIHELEGKNGLEMDDDLLFYIVRIYEENLEHLSDICMSYEKVDGLNEARNSRR